MKASHVRQIMVHMLLRWQPVSKVVLERVHRLCQVCNSIAVLPIPPCLCSSRTDCCGNAVAVQPGCGEPGYASDLEEGLDWVLEKHLAQPEPRQPGIVSMSLIISKQSSSAELITEKVEELLENGIVVVAAAGNFHEGALICLLG